MALYLDLVATFFRIGLFTFGGGYAMLPLLEREVVQKKGWATTEDLMDYYAIGQSTPGIIAVNTATFVGYYQAGLLGGIFATIGLVLPSLIIILIIASILDSVTSLTLLEHAFAGIRVAVSALVTFSVYRLGKKGIVDYFGLIWALMTFVAIAFLNISPLWIVVSSLVLGNIVQKVREGQSS